MLSAPVVAVVLIAAALHAGWNVAVRAGGDRRRETALLVVGGSLIAFVLLPFLPLPPAAAWPYLIVSACLNALYFVLIAEAYARGGVALAYPLMRGVAPMLTLIAAWLLLGETPPTVVWLGVATICLGVALLARRRGTPDDATTMRIALANALVIAAYTLIDAVGARISQQPMAYAVWLFPLAAAPTLIWLHRAAPPAWPSAYEVARGLGGAAASIAAYALVLWAMTRAPVAPVAALRETGILFGVVLASTFLGEQPGRRGWSGAVAIAAGAAMIRLAPG